MISSNFSSWELLSALASSASISFQLLLLSVTEDFTRHMEIICAEEQRSFLKVHSKMKTLGFAISVLKIREFNTSP